MRLNSLFIGSWLHAFTIDKVSSLREYPSLWGASIKWTLPLWVLSDVFLVYWLIENWSFTFDSIRSEIHSTRCRPWSSQRSHQRWSDCWISGQVWQLRSTWVSSFYAFLCGSYSFLTFLIMHVNLGSLLYLLSVEPDCNIFVTRFVFCCRYNAIAERRRNRWAWLSLHDTWSDGKGYREPYVYRSWPVLWKSVWHEYQVCEGGSRAGRHSSQHYRFFTHTQAHISRPAAAWHIDRQIRTGGGQKEPSN